MLPASLQQIADLFDGVTEPERREILLALADAARKWAPQEGERFDFSEVRQDEGCSDKVGIHLRLDGTGAIIRISLGPEVQALTRAMATLLCQGLNGCAPEVISAVPEEVIRHVAGAELVRIRSRTVYHLLRRLKAAAQSLRTPPNP